MTVKYDRQWVYYDSKGEPHSLGVGVPPTGDFDRVLDLQQHLDWVQEQVNKLKAGLPTTTVINYAMPPIEVIEWQALDKARKKAEDEAKHWKQAYDIAEDIKNNFWNQLNIAESYLKQIKARVLAYSESNRQVDGRTVMAIIDEAFSSIAKARGT